MTDFGLIWGRSWPKSVNLTSYVAQCDVYCSPIKVQFRSNLASLICVLIDLNLWLFVSQSEYLTSYVRPSDTTCFLMSKAQWHCSWSNRLLFVIQFVAINGHTYCHFWVDLSPLTAIFVAINGHICRNFWPDLSHQDFDRLKNGSNVRRKKNTFPLEKIFLPLSLE